MSNSKVANKDFKTGNNYEDQNLKQDNRDVTFLFVIL